MGASRIPRFETRQYLSSTAIHVGRPTYFLVRRSPLYYKDWACSLLRGQIIGQSWVCDINVNSDMVLNTTLSTLCVQLHFSDVFGLKCPSFFLGSSRVRGPLSHRYKSLKGLVRFPYIRTRLFLFKNQKYTHVSRRRNKNGTNPRNPAPDKITRYVSGSRAAASVTSRGPSIVSRLVYPICILHIWRLRPTSNLCNVILSLSISIINSINL